MFKHGLDLFPCDPLKPFQKFLHPRAAFQIFKKRAHWDPRVFEHSSSADFAGRPFDRRTFIPIKHAVSIRQICRLGKLLDTRHSRTPGLSSAQCFWRIDH